MRTSAIKKRPWVIRIKEDGQTFYVSPSIDLVLNLKKASHFTSRTVARRIAKGYRREGHSAAVVKDNT